MLVQLNKCVVVCCSDLQRGHSGDGCVTSSSWARVRRVARGVMYCEWYGVCDFIVWSVVEVCADYGGVNVFHVCLNFGVVYGVGVCVNVCGVFLRLGVVCCVVMLCSVEGVWGVVILSYL